MSIRRRLMAAFVAGGLLAGAIGAPAGAVVAPKLLLYPGSGCVYWTGGAGVVYTITILDGTDVLDVAAATTDGSGNGYICAPFPVVAGMKVRIQTSGYTRTITVPAFSVRTDRNGDVVSGLAPAGKSISVTVNRYATGTYGPGPTIAKTVTATASGTFSVDVTADGGFRGGDYVYVVYTNTTTGDEFRHSGQVEYMRVVRGSPTAEGHLNPGVTELELRTSAGAVRGRAYLAPGGSETYATGMFRTGAGTAVYPRAGDKVVGDFASDATLTVPAITVTADPGSDVVTLTCPGMTGQGAYISVRKADYSDSAYRSGTTNASGVRTWDVTADIDLAAGDVLYGKCRFDSGDEIVRHGRIAP
jgi:hypothetical protein